ncbi:hypothetical protein Pelo_1571 [Pelomyxa schiedti]|nr:hypothetical protein Pelo_1571 [Pelomyxa schiedti]
MNRQEDLLEAFRIFDDKGKGYLTSDEFTKVLRLGGVVDDNEIADLVDTMDIKGEDAIYYETLVPSLLKKQPDLLS